MADIDIVISDLRLAFLQGKYNESLKLATQALELDHIVRQQKNTQIGQKKMEIAFISTLFSKSW